MIYQQILALSSSRVGNSNYLEMAVPMVKQLLGEKQLTIAFIPFAFVDDNKQPLVNMVQQAFNDLPYNIKEVTLQNGPEIIEDADSIMVSGGNTFKLLHDLYKSQLFDLIIKKVKKGVPYIGWSAGSNITGATICTTNDMPVTEPESFKALGFFPFQINPHYYNQPVEGFNGETRDQRLTEFIKLNPLVPVVCLPEGTALHFSNGILKLMGTVNGILMHNKDGELLKTEISLEDDISYLLNM